MAIERMKSIWLFAPCGSGREVIDRLAATGLVHVADCGLQESEEHEALGVERLYPEAPGLELRVQQLSEIQAVLSRFHRAKQDLLASFITTPVEAGRQEVEHALAELDPAAMHDEVKQMESRFNELASEAQRAEDEVKMLAPLSGVDGLILGKKDQKNVTGFIGIMGERQFARLQEADCLPETAVLASVAQHGGQVVIEAGCPADQRAELLRPLEEAGFSVIEPEEETASVANYLRHRREHLKSLRKARRDAEKELKAYAREYRHKVEIVLGYWEERLRIVRAAQNMAESKRVTVAKLYVRDRDMPEFEERMAHDLPDALWEAGDPQEGESVPVSLRNPGLFAPAQFLITMFGSPNYFSFDPTFVVFFNFTLFFGICFGDAVYGLGLISIGWWLARRYRNYTGLRYLFTLLAYAGVPTLLVGVLTGSWAGSLFSASWLGEPNPFFGPANPLVVMAETLAVFNMVDRIMVALLIALFIGIANQMLGLACLSYSRYRHGDPVGAVLDSVFWFIALPAAVVLASTLFVDISSGMKNTAMGALGFSALGLVLTQGRDQKNIFAKLGMGLVSLYGVAGTYGFSSFLNDVLSYSRLLALGLATTIVGVAFNILANMARLTGVALVDILLVLVILIPGHGTNFFLSVIGSFVHSVRLIFVEFFGRFYEADAPAFEPLGCWTGRLYVTDARTVWPA